MFHTFGFSGTKTDSTADEAAPTIADNTMNRTASGNKYLTPFEGAIIAAWVLNDTITRARLNYPSMRDLGLPEIFPLAALAEPSANYPICQWGVNGPRVRKNEEFGVDSSNGASTVDTVHALVCLMDSLTPIPPGRRFTVRGTATQTLVANSWTSAPIALDQSLPYGQFGVIGMRVTCNDAAGARLVFTGANQFRPGCPVGETIAVDEPTQFFRYGRLGLWGKFDQTAPPQLECLGSTAGAETPAVILDLVHLGSTQQ